MTTAVFKYKKHTTNNKQQKLGSLVNTSSSETTDLYHAFLSECFKSHTRERWSMPVVRCFLLANHQSTQAW